MGFLCVCTAVDGTVVLETSAPAPDRGRNVFVGVFAVNENVSLLLKDPNFFLPTCYHVSPEHVGLRLSKVNNGPIWAEAEAVPSHGNRLAPISAGASHGNRLVPIYPKLLQANLTGVYECSAGQSKSHNDYSLSVVGKQGSLTTSWFVFQDV